MDILRSSLTDLLARKLEWLGQRQEVLAGNIAQADTPGYRAVDLVPLELGKAPRAEPARTLPGHLGQAAAAAAAGARPDPTSWELRPDGNGVVLEQQLLKASETQAEHTLAIDLYKKAVALVKTALDLGRS